MKRIEAIMDAVAAYNHYYADPESEAYELRNPLLMIGPEGKRRFSCHRAGYASGMDRVLKYCLTHPNDDIASLLTFCGIKMKQQQENTLDFMSRCANSTLTLQTKLVWFTQNG